MFKRIIEGDVSLASLYIDVLPDFFKDLEIRGNFDCSENPLVSLPEGLSVKDNLKLFDTKITSLPKGLIVGGSLYLGNTLITSLPKGLRVGGQIYRRELSF
jgi:hypothetical protein